MSRPVTKLSLTYCDKLRIVCAEAKRVPNVGAGSKAVAHNIGINRTTLSKTMNGQYVSVRTAAVVKQYVDEHFREMRPKEMTNTGFSREGFEAYLRSAGISEDRMHIIWRAFWEAKTQTRITNGRRVALTR